MSHVVIDSCGFRIVCDIFYQCPTPWLTVSSSIYFTVLCNQLDYRVALVGDFTLCYAQVFVVVTFASSLV